MRPIDHLVLPVTTLALARSRLASLGFTVAPDSRHPFGTGNACVFFADRTYLEPITILDRASADVAASEGVFFVKRLKRFNERQGEGFAMVAVRSEDAEADAARFGTAGIGGEPVFQFSRQVALPDGSVGEISFALAYADDPAAPDATLFACQRLEAEALFQPGYLDHPNGAVGIRTVTAVAAGPDVYAGFIAAVADTTGPEGKSDPAPISVATPDTFRRRYGLEPPDPRRGLLFAALEIAVVDVEKAVGYAGPTAIRHEGNIVVPPGPGLSAVLVFTRSTDG